jgi:hypothetical protein
MLQLRLICPEELKYLSAGINEVISSLPSDLNGTITAVYNEKLQGLQVNITEAGGDISFSRANELFRGIGLIAGGLINNEEPKTITQKLPFETLGVMYDCSRNSVPTVATAKKILVKMALMGYNTLMLYTEDTYTVESRPEFGHYRGRYSREELRAVDDYAYALGIEVIPCIQALAHLERFLRWQNTCDIKDNDYILLAKMIKYTL